MSRTTTVPNFKSSWSGVWFFRANIPPHTHIDDNLTKWSQYPCRRTTSSAWIANCRHDYNPALLYYTWYFYNNSSPPRSCFHRHDVSQWRRSQVKSGGGGGKYWEDWRVGSGRSCALHSWGSGACPQKKNKFCAKNYAILSKFWYFFPILQQKVGDYPPVLKVGDLSPCLPPVPTPMTSVSMLANMITQKKTTRPIYTKFGGKVANGPRKNNCWIFMVIRITLHWGLGYTEVSK